MANSRISCRRPPASSGTRTHAVICDLWMSSIAQRSIKRFMNPPKGRRTRTTARESLMRWSLNHVLKATVRGARGSRVPLIIGFCWRQVEPTSTKAVVEHFSPPGLPRPACTNIFIRSGRAPPGAHESLIWRVVCQGGRRDFSHLALGVSGCVGVGWVGGGPGCCARRAVSLICAGLGVPQDHGSSWGAAV